MALHAVIMAGGKGERLWPLSTPGMPKQLHSLGTGSSLIRSTYERIRGIADSSRIYVVTNESTAGKIREHIPELPAANVLVEPVGRNTAPCVAYAALHISAADKDAVMAVFPSDHLVTDPERFSSAITFGMEALERHPELLITLGMVPDHPETGYGYIASGEVMHRNSGFSLHRVHTFKEKPDIETARRYIAEGFLWNAGMFLWRVDTILSAFKTHLPDMHGMLMRMAGQGRITSGSVDEFYREVESVSIDYGIMEKAPHVGVIPAEFGWNDVGSWDALGKVLPGDGSGNVTSGRVFLEDSTRNVVWARDKQVVLIGVEDLVVVEGEGAILVCPRSLSGHVGRISKKAKG